MNIFSRLRARFRWKKETKGLFAELDALSRESITGLREAASLRKQLDRLFVRWQLADLVGDEHASTEVGIEIRLCKIAATYFLSRRMICNSQSPSFKD